MEGKWGADRVWEGSKKSYFLSHVYAKSERRINGEV